MIPDARIGSPVTSPPALADSRINELASTIADKVVARWARESRFEGDRSLVEKAHARQARPSLAGSSRALLDQATCQELVSIIVPAFNAADYIAETIESLLSQTHPAMQIIVVDDGSTDETPRILERYRQRYAIDVVRLPRNSGIARAKNEGIKAARGEWLGFLSADDLYYPEAVATLLCALHSDVESDLAYADFDYIGESDYCDNSMLVEHLGPVHFDDLMVPKITVGMCAIFRRSLLGGRELPVDESQELDGVEDTVLWQDLWRKTPFLHVPKALGSYRRHDEQFTRRIVQSSGYEPLLERSRERYRQRYGPVRRCLFVYPWCCIGGAERVMAQLAIGLRRFGVVCEACFLEDGGGLSYFSSICPTTILDQVRGSTPRVQALAEVIRKGGYDLVHHSFVEELAEALTIADFAGPVVEVDHGWPERCQAERLRPDALVTVSHYQAAVLRRCGVSLPARVIYNGVDPTRLAEVPQPEVALAGSRPHPIVAWVGRVSEFKRPRLFLEMVAQLSTQRPDLRFCMVGNAGPYTAADDLEAIMLACQAYPNLRYVSGVPPSQMPLLYGLVRASEGLVVMTSGGEPFGLVAIEAMANGIPVVASASGGVIEILSDGIEGVLVPEPYSPTEAGRAVLKLLDDAAAYRRMSQAARQKVAGMFTLDAMIRSYWDLYASLCCWEKTDALSSR